MVQDKPLLLLGMDLKDMVVLLVDQLAVGLVTSSNELQLLKAVLSLVVLGEGKVTV